MGITYLHVLLINYLFLFPLFISNLTYGTYKFKSYRFNSKLYLIIYLFSLLINAFGIWKTILLFDNVFCASGYTGEDVGVYTSFTEYDSGLILILLSILVYILNIISSIKSESVLFIDFDFYFPEPLTCSLYKEQIVPIRGLALPPQHVGGAGQQRLINFNIYPQGRSGSAEAIKVLLPNFITLPPAWYFSFYQEGARGGARGFGYLSLYPQMLGCAMWPQRAVFCGVVGSDLVTQSVRQATLIEGGAVSLNNPPVFSKTGNLSTPPLAPYSEGAEMVNKSAGLNNQYDVGDNNLNNTNLILTLVCLFFT